ncbi:hypothetical protein CVU37_11235 [candidate division BRC1 bacterium HGW-BRC1-1]|nr:MAG: hypothetical protein CVU37_11235 [candidate division BRC1 bacterium HGW-BRC1-1]
MVHLDSIMRIRPFHILAALFVCLLLLSSNAEARRVYVVTKADGSVKVIDPERSLKNRVLNFPKRILGFTRPAQKSTSQPEGFGRRITQRDMQTGTRPSSVIKESVTDSVGAVVDTTGAAVGTLRRVTGRAANVAATAAVVAY